MNNRVLTLALLMFAACTTTNALAIEWPLSLSEAKAYGESTTPNAITGDVAYNLDRSTPTGASADITTPFELAAFTYSNKKVMYEKVEASDLAEIHRTKYLNITARAFSTFLKANDDMVVVLKQNGKVITSSYESNPDSDVTEYPEVGYRTNRHFKFLLSSFRYNQPFTVVLANAVSDGGFKKSEATWDVEPSKFR